MPYVPVAPVTRDRLLDAAERRWDGILQRRPHLKPAVVLQQRLLTLVIDLAHTIDGGRLPRLSLPPKYIETKLARGVPVLAGEPIPLPVQLLHASLLELCGALASGGAGEAAEHIQSAIQSGGMEAGSLLAASLARDQIAIRTSAVHRGLAPDLVWLVAELAVSPFAHALQCALFASAAENAVTSLGAALTSWNRGYCPACGSGPALAEVVGGRRVLRCSFCAVAWELATYACIYCEEDADPFVTAAADEERKDRRIELCSHCAGYLKTVDVPTLSPFPLLAIADLETMDLDLIAMERGHTRPPLPGVATRTPRR
jgi:formate dehydrogenase maturation protein FdhE